MDDEVVTSKQIHHTHTHNNNKNNNNYHQFLKVLEALKEADLKVLLELETESSNSILSSDPHLSNLSSHLSDLKLLVQTQEQESNKSSKHRRITSFFSNKLRAHEISKVSTLIESEIQAWIDRETTNELSKILEEWSSNNPDSEENLLSKLSQFRARLDKGFDIYFQEMLLKSRIYSLLESLLCKTSISKRVLEIAAYTLKELILFNKDVFVGQVLGGKTIKGLVKMGSLCGLDVLKSLIKAIKSPLVDELESFGGILKIIETLEDSGELELKIMALDVIMEIGYYGRKGAIEAMLNGGLIKKLVNLQRSELGGDLIDNIGKSDEGKEVNLQLLEIHPFAKCVTKFAVQLEVGEGLRQREKRAFKQEILKRVREASVDDAEAATIFAEVLWGSSP